MHLSLNCDMGEGVTDDSMIMPHISQANVCCGAHAGSPDITRTTIKNAVTHGVSIGAHPSYPDPDNFGRISMSMTPDALQATLKQQVGLIMNICHDCKTTMDYVKPHGALNHDMVKNRDVLQILCLFMADLQSEHGRPIPLMIPTCNHQNALAEIAQQHGVPILWEVFADRAYEADGTLRARTHRDATHNTPHAIIEQCQHILEHRTITAHNSDIELDVSMAQSLCVHGDNLASIESLPTLKTMVEGA